jgi:hypothetical protein
VQNFLAPEFFKNRKHRCQGVQAFAHINTGYVRIKKRILLGCPGQGFGKRGQAGYRDGICFFQRIFNRFFLVGKLVFFGLARGNQYKDGKAQQAPG